MTIEEFVKAFAAEFDETPAEQFKSNTEYKSLDEWGSLTALSIIALAMEVFGKKLLEQNFVLAIQSRIYTT